MKLYLHIGYPRTGTTVLQKHLFPKHPQINYLGKDLSRSLSEENLNIKFKPNIYEIIDLLLYLSDEEFNQRYNYILRKLDSLELSASRTNIISEEYIILKSIHYRKASEKRLENFLSRFEKVFREKKIDIYYFFTIRNTYEIIKSIYNVTTIGSGSIVYSPSELVQSLKDNKFDNLRLKIFMNGFFYYKLYKHICSISKPNRVKMLLYEKLKFNSDEYLDELSDFLEINNALSKELIGNKIENSSDENRKENIYINNIFIVLYYKIIKNLKSPKNIFLMFSNKIFAFFNILFFRIPKTLDINTKFKTKGLSKKQRKDFINKGRLELINNKNLIKKYYEEDLKLLQKELKLGLSKHNYFVD